MQLPGAEPAQPPVRRWIGLGVLLFGLGCGGRSALTSTNDVGSGASGSGDGSRGSGAGRTSTVPCNRAADCKSLGTAYACQNGTCRERTLRPCVYKGVTHQSDTEFMDGCDRCVCQDGRMACLIVECGDAGIGVQDGG